MPKATVERIKSKGVEFANIEDAGAAVLQLASDSSLNGRALAVVTRSEDPRGYFDLSREQMDVAQPGSFIDRNMKTVVSSGHRIERK
jgi:hypothetical protein